MTLYRGDCLAVLREMPDESVDCVITSPPYYGLRSYATGTTWDGGDPACDHVKPFVPRADRPSGESGMGRGSVYNDAQDVGKNIYRDLCLRCGARRVEETIWPAAGDPPQPLAEIDDGHDHVWGDVARAQRGGGSNPKIATKGTDNYGVVPAGSSSLCAICGAWRGQLGLEPTPDLYVAHIVLIFREVRRVLRRRGTLWLNMGDSYAAKPGQGGADDTMMTAEKRRKRIMRGSGRWGLGSRSATPGSGVKPKDLLGMPWEVAFALRADGWYLRADIIWHKPNAMPESVIDRPTKSHEYIFLMAKSERYHYDGHAIKEPFAESSLARVAQPGFWQQTGGPKDYATTGTNGNRSARGALENLANAMGAGYARGANEYNAWLGEMARASYAAGYDEGVDDVGGVTYEAWRSAWAEANPAPDVPPAPWQREPVGPTLFEFTGDAPLGRPSTSRGQERTLVKDARWDERHAGYDAIEDGLGGRNKRTVWTIPTEPYAEAHFATFPTDLPVAPIAAGCPELVCSKCGEPRERLLARTTMKVRVSGRAAELAEAQGIRTAIRSGVARAQNNRSGHMDEPATAETIGWSDCGHGALVKGTVLDIFAGSGTTLAVARDMGRLAIGIEISDEYVELIRARTMQEALL